MELAIIDFDVILFIMGLENASTKIFDIYYDIVRLLNINISREACFKLYIKYKNSYGHLKNYLSLLGSNIDKDKFDSEFYRRYKQLYFNKDREELSIFKEKIQYNFEKISKEYLIYFVGITNKEFIYMVLDFFELDKYFNGMKIGENFEEYRTFISEILKGRETLAIKGVNFMCFTSFDVQKKSVIEEYKDEFQVDFINISEIYN